MPTNFHDHQLRVSNRLVSPQAYIDRLVCVWRYLMYNVSCCVILLLMSAVDTSGAGCSPGSHVCFMQN
jgi:hypothetical protein